MLAYQRSVHIVNRDIYIRPSISAQVHTYIMYNIIIARVIKSRQLAKLTMYDCESQFYNLSMLVCR